MLVLTRKEGQSITAGDVTVHVRRISGNSVSIGVDAPPTVRILRDDAVSVIDVEAETPSEFIARIGELAASGSSPELIAAEVSRYQGVDLT
ncbi:carbon storage regulator [Kordiimonas sp.]|uniref:carbon storage regulator n=1 Tax=Kordiimonas sp. TaxID=1970157 RepID=UPI003A8E7298